jgi:hypothetical protein
MSETDPWQPIETTFLSARGEIRAAQDVVLAEHERLARLDAIRTPRHVSNEVERVMAGRVLIDKGAQQ